VREQSPALDRMRATPWRTAFGPDARLDTDFIA
jgi:hypothetical protein